MRVAEVRSGILGALLDIAERIASTRYGGHFTIMRFTTGWKAVFGTPDISVGGSDYDKVFEMLTFKSVEGAVIEAIKSEI